MAEIETVKVKNNSELGYAVINASDFVEGEHTLYEEPKINEKPQLAEKPQAPTGNADPKPAKSAADKQRKVTVLDPPEPPSVDTNASNSSGVLNPIL